MEAGSNPIATYDRHIKQDPLILLALAYCNLRMFTANEKVFKLFSKRSFFIPKYIIRHMKTK